MLCGLTAAFALAADIDQYGSTDARSLGFVTEALAWVIRKLSRGHRHGMHSLVGAGLFTAAAWLACRGTGPQGRKRSLTWTNVPRSFPCRLCSRWPAATFRARTVRTAGLTARQASIVA